MRAQTVAGLLLLLALTSCGTTEPAAQALPGQVAANAQALLAAYDTDRDGGLSPAEGEKLGLVGEAFAAADANQDGALAPAEALGLVGWLLERGWRLAPQG